MARFAVGEKVAWVSRSGIRRTGAVLEELPGRQFAVRLDGVPIEQAVDVERLSRLDGVDEPARPAIAPDGPPVSERGRRGGLAAAARMTAKQRSERARKAAVARQEKRRAEEPAAEPLEAKKPSPAERIRAGGSIGGRRAAAKLTPEERSERARRAGLAAAAARRARAAAARGEEPGAEPPPASEPLSTRGEIPPEGRLEPAPEELDLEPPADVAASAPRSDGLDAGEGVVMDHLTAAWDAFQDLRGGHVYELREFGESLHRLQRILAGRAIRRLYPEGWS